MATIYPMTRRSKAKNIFIFYLYISSRLSDWHSFISCPPVLQCTIIIIIIIIIILTYNIFIKYKSRERAL